MKSKFESRIAEIIKEEVNPIFGQRTTHIAELIDRTAGREDEFSKDVQVFAAALEQLATYGEQADDVRKASKALAKMMYAEWA